MRNKEVGKQTLTFTFERGEGRLRNMEVRNRFGRDEWGCGNEKEEQIALHNNKREEARN